jgi:hypothetical protein
MLTFYAMILFLVSTMCQELKAAVDEQIAIDASVEEMTKVLEWNDSKKN